MKLNQITALLAICIVFASACHRVVDHDTSGKTGVFTFKGQPISSTSDVVVSASGLLKERNLNWGEPIEILWQDELNRYLVIYPTPSREKMKMGDRGVFVWTNGETITMPQL